MSDLILSVFQVMVILSENILFQIFVILLCIGIVSTPLTRFLDSFDIQIDKDKIIDYLIDLKIFKED